MGPDEIDGVEIRGRGLAQKNKIGQLTNRKKSSSSERRGKNWRSMNSLDGSRSPSRTSTPRKIEVRRVRSRHSKSRDRIWLVGNPESFNRRVNQKYSISRDESADLEGEGEDGRRSSNSDYYYFVPALL